MRTKLLSAVAMLLATFALCTSAIAAPPGTVRATERDASWNATTSKISPSRLNLSADGGVSWFNQTAIKFRDSTPHAWAGPALTYWWSDNLNVKTTLKFSLVEDSKAKELEARASIGADWLFPWNWGKSSATTTE